MSNKKLERPSVTSKKSNDPSKNQQMISTLIKKASNAQDPPKVTVLNFHSKASNLDRIEKIELLDPFLNLEELNLSYNLIAKIENLGTLTKLKELNLAENSIRRIEGLESLTCLEVLNLNGNQIQEIPMSLSTNSALKTLKIARNKIKDLQMILPIAELRSLQSLQVLDNPFAKQMSHIEVLFMVNKSLVSVDSKRLDNDLLMNLRLAAMECDARSLYEKKESEITNLKSRVNNGLKKNEDFSKIKERCEFLENEVENKTLACEAKVRECMEKIARISELEQELSHYKIEVLFLRLNAKTEKSEEYSNEKGVLIKLEKQTNFLRTMQEECEKDLLSLSEQNKRLLERLSAEEKNEYFQQKVDENATVEAVLKEKLENIQLESEKIEKDREELLNRLFLTKNLENPDEIHLISSTEDKATQTNQGLEVLSQEIDYNNERVISRSISNSPNQNNNNYEGSNEKVVLSTDNPMNEENIGFIEEIQKLFGRISRFLKKKPLVDSNSSNITLHTQIKSILGYFKAKEEQILRFDEEKSRFIEDLARETQELTENWRLFDKKKLEYKQKLTEEKDLLYKELDEEYRKISKMRHNHQSPPSTMSKVKRNFLESNEKPRETREKLYEFKENRDQLDETIEERSRKAHILEQALKQLLEKNAQEEVVLSKLNQETSHKTAELEKIHAQVIEKQQIAQNLNQQLGNYESFLVEFNSLKANYQRNQSENQALMAKLSENQAKYEESNLRLTLQDQNLLSLKRHIEGLSQQAREKERELSEMDQKIREKELVLQDFQRKEAEYSSLVGNFDEFMRQKTAKEEELRNCEKVLAVKEIQLNSLNNEIDEKFGDLEGLQATISENQTSFKTVLKENKEVLEKIKDEMSRKSIESRGLTERVDVLTEKARILAESVKTSEETLLNSQKKEGELRTEYQRLKDKLSDMQTDEAKSGKRIEKARMTERDLCERIEEMERYIDELRREKQAFVEKQAEIKRKEDELYVLMALKGEIPDQKVFERIREMTEAYYLYQKTKNSDTAGNTMNSNESPAKGKREKVIVKINSPAIVKQHQHSSLMKSPASSAKLRGRDSEENENSGGSTNQKKGELSMKIFEAEKEISNLKKKLEAQELS